MPGWTGRASSVTTCGWSSQILLRVFDLEHPGALWDAVAEAGEQGGFAAVRAADHQDAQAPADRFDQGVHDCLRCHGPGDDLGGWDGLRLEQADRDGREAFSGSDDGMQDLDACAARQALLTGQLCIHRWRGFVAGPSERGQQRLDGPPDIILGRVDIQKHESCSPLGTTQTEPSG